MIQVITDAIAPPFYFITSQLLTYSFAGVTLGGIIFIGAMFGIAVGILKKK